MSAIIRVKRKKTEEPLNAFVLNCKKRKLNDDIIEDLLTTKDEVSTIVKFAGTVESQDENTAVQITKLTKDEAKQLALKSRKPNILEKGRQEMRQNIQENRFKVVNCYRAIKATDDSSIENNKEVTIVDVEKQTNSEQSSTSAATSSSNNDTNSDNFVYDLYLPETAEIPQTDNTDLVENYFSVRPFDDLVYEDQANDEDDPESEDSEDSNVENYFKNDYPDTEEDNSSIGETDMRHAINNMDLDGELDLSSDEEENYRNGFIYSVDSEAIGFEDDIDYCDVNRYGEAYARYKAKIFKKQNKENYEYDSDQDDDYDSD